MIKIVIIIIALLCFGAVMILGIFQGGKNEKKL